MCLCKENHWCRTWEEPQNGEYPCSEHAQGCNEYKLETFVRVCYDGSCVIVEIDEVKNYKIDGATFQNVKLTRDQFEKMPEFQGF